MGKRTVKCVDGDTLSWVVNGAEVAVICTDRAFALRVCESRIHRDLAILQYMYIRIHIRTCTMQYNMGFT